MAERGGDKEKAAGRGYEAEETWMRWRSRILTYPGIDQVLAHGENKVSFTLEDGLQVDVRLLEKVNFGAALLYFTGSKEHNVKLRGRANEMGYTLNEYELATLAEGDAWKTGKANPRADRLPHLRASRRRSQNRKRREQGGPKRRFARS